MNDFNVKVLFLIQLPPPIHGQSTMNKYIYESEVIKNEFETKFVDISPAKSLNDIGKLSLKKIFRTLQILVESFLAIIIFKPTIIYITMSHLGIAFFKDAIIVIISKLFSRSTIYIHLHGRGINEIVSKSKLFRKMYSTVLNGTEVIILSTKLKSDIQKVYFKVPHILPNGIAIVDIPKPLVDNEYMTIIFLSNLVRAKGIEIFIEILHNLKNKSKKFHAFIIGQEADFSFKEVETLIFNKNLEGFVSILGPKFDKDKNEILNKADILIFPSSYQNEAFPLVLLEAMQYGVCCVSNVIGGTSNIIEDGVDGFLVENNDIEEYVKVVTSLTNDLNLRSKIKRNAQNKFRSQFTIGHFESNLINLLKKNKQ